MTRNAALIVMILLSLPIIAACGSATFPFTAVKILPEDCRVVAGEQMPLKLNGVIPSQAFVDWAADKGRVTFLLTGSDAVFIAPSEPGVVTISASITPAMSSADTHPTRQCTVIAPREMAQASGVEDLFQFWLGLPEQPRSY